MKLCKACWKTLPEDEFGSKKCHDGVTRLRSYCLLCRRQAAKRVRHHAKAVGAGFSQDPDRPRAL